MNQQVPTAPPNPAGGGSKSTMWILLALLIVILAAGAYYYFAIYSKKTTATTAPTTPATNNFSSAATSWLTYAQTPGAEEASEGNSAVKFTIDYPNTWNYKVLDDEVKAQGAGDVLHMVAFATGPKENINIITRDLSITAQSTTMDKFLAPIESSYQEANKSNDITKTEGTAGGQKMVKIVDKNGPLYVVVQSPGSWILVFESDKNLSTTIDKMLATLKF